ncbi:hypothetical protein [Halobacteriovorax marinus]|uniref:hypothetical protein n=1 Tax=Halobacteriovorax marinus TaxID=97084 RepID=UPI003A90EC2A
MNITELTELNELKDYIEKNELKEKIIFLINHSYQITEGSDSDKARCKSYIKNINTFLDKINSCNKMNAFLTSMTPSLIDRTTFDSVLGAFKKTGNLEQIEDALKSIMYYSDLILNYHAYQSQFINFEGLLNLNNSIVFTMDINRTVLLKESYKKIKNISDILESIKKITGEEIEFEINHVEDGSLRAFVTGSLLTLNIISPLCSSVTKNISEIVDLHHKSQVNQIERDLKKEELRHIKKMNELDETQISEEQKRHKKIVDLKQKQYKAKIENLQNQLEIELDYIMQEIIISNPSFFEGNNNHLLLKQISKKLITHFSTGGYVEILELEYLTPGESDSPSALSKTIEYTDKVKNLSLEELLLLEHLSKDDEVE